MRLSVSTVEAFHLLQTEEWMDADRFADQMLRREEPSDVLLLGRAFDQVLEDPAAHRVGDIYSCDGHDFDGDKTDELIEQLPTGIPQVSSTLEIAGHTVAGRCDLIEGVRTHDWKVTKQINLQRYLDSYQWRLYLLMFGCREFVYHPLQLFRERDTGRYVPTNYTPVRTFAYPGMDADVERMVDACACYLQSSGLAQQIEAQRAQQRAAA